MTTLPNPSPLSRKPASESSESPFTFLFITLYLLPLLYILVEYGKDIHIQNEVHFIFPLSFILFYFLILLLYSMSQLQFPLPPCLSVSISIAPSRSTSPLFLFRKEWVFQRYQQNRAQLVTIRLGTNYYQGRQVHPVRGNLFLHSNSTVTKTISCWFFFLLYVSGLSI